MSLDNLTQLEEDELKRAFEEFDKDRDGSFNINDLTTVMQYLGMTPTDHELRDIINEVDTEGKGVINFQEFVDVMVLKMKDADAEDALKEAFRLFDADGNGYISGEELKHVMMTMGEKMSEEEVDEMIEAADTEQDGQINYEEFVRMLMMS